MDNVIAVLTPHVRRATSRALSRLPRRCHAAHLIEPEDLAQAIWTRVLPRVPRCGPLPPAAILATMCRCAAVDELRIRVRYRHDATRWRAHVHLGDPGDAGTPGLPVGLLSISAADVLGQMIVEEMLATLNPRRRAAMTCRLAGMTEGETAQALGVGVAAAASLVFQARADLTQLLGANRKAPGRHRSPRSDLAGSETR